jgi:demethylspheroidene O-methyltransferase
LADDALETGVLRGARSLLDVGGGEGAFLERVHRSDPSIRLHLLERPAVAERARKRLAAAGVGPVDISTADARTDAYPGPMDAVSLVRVLHDHDDPEALAILRRARAALGAGGRLVVVEPMRGIPGTQCVSDVYFNLYLAALGQGRTRSLGELNRLFRAAGLAPGQRIRTLRPHFTQVVVTQPETSAGCEF